MRKFWLVFLLLILASPVEARYVLVSWDAVAGATSYRLYWGPTSGGPYTYEITDDSITTNSHQLSINEEDTYMVVTAYDGVDESAASDELYISTLQQDGGVTPEQIAVFLPGDFPPTMTATLRYRKLGEESWTTGHDLYHIDSSAVEDGFAWTIFDLDQGSTYAVEVTTHDGGDEVVYVQNMYTRTLPAAAGAVTKTITAGSTTSQINAILNTAVAGDVIEFENGTYTATTGEGIKITSREGTEAEPIYIRGESRDGVILSDTTGNVFEADFSQHFVLENLTIQGTGVDAGWPPSLTGIYLYMNTNHDDKYNITIRNTTITGVDLGIIASSNKGRQILIYENILQGNNTWDQDLWGLVDGKTGGPDGDYDIDGNQSSMWDDEGIKLRGYANVAFNNTIDGFGDAINLGVAAVHAYRNKITVMGDDGCEGDGGYRNLSFYDNYIANAASLSSSQVIKNGPFIVFRNVAINLSRSRFIKMNGTQHGTFLYNNTVVNTAHPNVSDGVIGDRDWIWLQYNDGATKNMALQNNIFIRQNYTNGKMLANQAADEPIDFNHNSWYPDGQVMWTKMNGTSWSSLAAAYTGMAAVTPVFSDETKLHENDVIEDAQPFVKPIVLGADVHTEITTMYTPILSATAKSKNSGTIIVGITDGYTGALPDRGAIISGRSLVTYGATEAPVATSTAIGSGTTAVQLGL